MGLTGKPGAVDIALEIFTSIAIRVLYKDLFMPPLEFNIFNQMLNKLYTGVNL